MVTRLESLLRKTWLQISPPRECVGNRVALPELLAQMDGYDGDSVEDMPLSEDEKRERLRHFGNVISASGLGLNGSILDLASGATSLAYLYPDTVAVDNDPRKIKMLRKDGIEGVVADIDRLPFKEKSFDYVVSISPPQKPIVLHSDGHCHFTVDKEYNSRLVDTALKIARKKALISSYDITLHPPHSHLIEKRETNGRHYVLYRSSNKSV